MLKNPNYLLNLFIYYNFKSSNVFDYMWSVQCKVTKEEKNFECDVLRVILYKTFFFFF